MPYNNFMPTTGGLGMVPFLGSGARPDAIRMKGKQNWPLPPEPQGNPFAPAGAAETGGTQFDPTAAIQGLGGITGDDLGGLAGTLGGGGGGLRKKAGGMMGQMAGKAIGNAIMPGLGGMIGGGLGGSLGGK